MLSLLIKPFVALEETMCKCSMNCHATFVGAEVRQWQAKEENPGCMRWV